MQQLVVRHGADAHLHEEAVMAEDPVLDQVVEKILFPSRYP